MSERVGKINLLVANAGGYFTDDEIQIVENARDAAEEYIAGLFDFDYAVDIVVTAPSFLQSTITEDGIVGRTYSSRLIAVTINKDEKEITEDSVFETIVHELAHSMRWEKQPEYSKTLFDGMIMEGLAVTLEVKAMEDTGREKQFFLTEMLKTEQEMADNIIEQLSDKLGDTEYNYHALFYTGTESLPRWTGYILGYYFVKKYLEETGSSIEEATVASYKEFQSIKN